MSELAKRPTEGGAVSSITHSAEKLIITVSADRTSYSISTSSSVVTNTSNTQRTTLGLVLVIASDLAEILK